MVTITVDNVYAKIIGMDKEMEEEIWVLLQFPVEVWQRGDRMTMFRHLYNRKTKKTYTGLVPYVTEYFDKEGIEYKIKDTRKKPEQNGGFKLVKYLDKDKKIQLQARPYQQELIDNCADREIIQAATGAGKAMPLDTDILTPKGFVPLWKVHTGDLVYDEHGNLTTVLAEYPQEEQKEIWVLEFEDGTKARCCIEHLWKIKVDGVWCEATTDIVASLSKTREVYIPICKPIEFSGSDNVRFAKCFFVGILLGNKSINEINKSEITIDGQMRLLDKYKYSSIQCRKNLLRGLLETYGEDSNGNIAVRLNNALLAQDIQFLARSLGYRTKLFDETKVEIIGYEQEIKPRDLRITKVYNTGIKTDMKCLTVDSPDHTYICNDFLVTHNTFVLAGIIAKINVKPVLVFADKITLCTQLRDEIQKFLGTEVGLVGGGQKDYKDITVVSLQSAEKEYNEKAKLVMWDECLTADTQITMADGNKVTIGAMYAARNNGDVYVRSYNLRKKCFESKQITDFYRSPLSRGGKKLMQISVVCNNHVYIMRCTNNHKVYVVGAGYVPAEHLKVDDMMIVYNGQSCGQGTVSQIKIYTDAELQELYGTKDIYVYDITVADNHNLFADDILVSNCHHIPANTAVQVANQCTNAYYRIGVSATPWRDAGDDMLIEAVLSKRDNTYNINASKLIDLGYLIKPTIYFVDCKQVFKGKNYNDIYNQAIVNNAKRNHIIQVITHKMYDKGHTVLVLVKSVKHGETLENLLNGIIKCETTTINVEHNGKNNTVRVSGIEFLSGSDKAVRRKAVMQAVKEGKCKILIATTIADEGLDLPNLDTLILAGGGKSSTRAFQRIGRVLRLAKGKQAAYVFDFRDYTPMLRRHAATRMKLYHAEPLWEVVPEFVPSMFADIK